MTVKAIVWTYTKTLGLAAAIVAGFAAMLDFWGWL